MSRSPFSAPASLVITLDLQEERLALTSTGLRSAPGLWAVACARVLAHARRCDWDVVHVRAECADGGGRRPIPGLEPRPLEPILTRGGLSPLGLRSLAAQAQDYDDVYLVGFWLSAPGLAALFHAWDAGLRLTVVDDAVSVGPGESFPDVTEVTLRRLAKPYHRSTRSELLLTHAEPAFTRLAANNA